MTRMTGPDCAVMCNLINTHTHTHTHIDRQIFGMIGQIFSTLNRRSKKGKGKMEGRKRRRMKEGKKGAYYLFHSFVRRKASIRTS